MNNHEPHEIHSAASGRNQMNLRAKHAKHAKKNDRYSKPPRALRALRETINFMPIMRLGILQRIIELKKQRFERLYYERWRRVGWASLFQGRHPATLRVPAARRGDLRQTSLRETRFPHEVCLGLAGRLGFVFGSTLLVFGSREDRYAM